MPATNLSQSDQARAITDASSKYGVPWVILMGVYGLETAWGSNIATSSAGAVGPFQFTAANKGTGVNYPMTNTPSLAEFRQQANAAAAYLAALYKQHGNNWDAALHAYSGGGYGLDQLKGQIQHLSGGWLLSLQSAGAPGIKGAGGLAGSIDSIINAPIKAGGAVAGALNAAGNAAGSIAGLVTSTDFWLRLGEGILGMLLLLLGLRAVTGTGEANPLKLGAKAAAKVARV